MIPIESGSVYCQFVEPLRVAKGPDGDIVTLHFAERVVKLEDISVGDRVVTSYIAALEGEVCEPTEEELWMG